MHFALKLQAEWHSLHVSVTLRLGLLVMLHVDAESCSATTHTWSGTAASGAAFKGLVMQRRTDEP